MQDKQRELFQSRLKRLKQENDELKAKLISLRKDNAETLRSMARNETLLESMPAGLFLLQDRKILRANNTILANLGYRHEDIIGTDFLDLIHPDDREYVKKIHGLWESLRISPDQYEARIAASSGMPAYYEVRCRRIRFHNRTAFLLIATSIKERLKKEQETAKNERMDTITTMAAGVRDKLGPFLDIILEASGEFKAHGKLGNKRIEELFNRLENALSKALNVNDGLEIIAETGKAKQSPIIFSLNKAVDTAIQSAEGLCRELAGQRGIKLSLKSYPRSSSFIEGDIKGITNALFQLIRNAIEAMPDGGDIYITTEDNNGDAHVYIQDNGTGVRESYKERIFDPFFTTKKGAMGLGLSISSSIVKRHGGDIEFTSRDADGAIFHVRIPITGQKPATGIKNRRKKITNSKIMIIQENDIAREVLSHPLKIKGCRITKAVNAPEGLAKLKNMSFDMLIADDAALNMERDAFIRKARKTAPGISIALIVDAGEISGTDRRYGLEADLIINKPLDVNPNVKRILEILAEKS
ncbi:MAG: PAS domain S-box protein [Deltaproteobacteria bacterium]|nr:PAS domain S-box protein [Deltaproteobacteria bacterium]